MLTSEAVRRQMEERERLAQHKARLESAGLSPGEVLPALDPLRSFHLQLDEEIESYEQAT